VSLVFSPTAGRRLRASELLEMVTQINSLTAPGWTSYTPAWTAAGTAPALGNGTLTGRSRRAANSDLITVEINLTIGSTSTVGTSDWRFSLPTNANASDLAVGSAWLLDSGTTERDAVARLLSVSTVSVICPTGPIGLGVPWTWATGDQVRITVQYQPA
jgi:transcription elongation factor